MICTAPRPGRGSRDPASGGRLAIKLLLPVLLVALFRTSAPAQWVVDASAGIGEYDPVAVSVGTRSAILGVRREGPRWLYLSGGLPLDSAGLPWTAAGAGTRWRNRTLGLGVGVDLSAHGHAYRARALDASGAGVVLEALPSVGWGGSTARVDVHTGLVHYSSVFNGITSARSLLDAGARVTAAPAAGVTLEAESRYLRAQEGGYPFAGATLEVALGAGALTAHAGRWLADALSEAQWGLGGRFLVGTRTRVYASLEQEAPHPLYWNDRRRSWTIGVSHALGRAVEAWAPTAPLPVRTGGMVEIRIPLAESEAPPSVGGDFNEWKPVPMRRSGSDWVISLPLEPGVYQYAFQRADGAWFVPESVPNRVDDGFGGTNAVLVVGEAAR